MKNTHDTDDKLFGAWDSFAIIIGIVLGVGIFRVPAEVAQYLSTPKLIILAWFIGGVFSFLGAICYAELSSCFPKTGGDYVYLNKSYGGLVSFLYGWSNILVIRPGSIAAVSFIFAEHLASLFSLQAYMIKWLAVCLVLLLSLINGVRPSHGKYLQSVSSGLKAAALLAIIFFGALLPKGDIANFHSLKTSTNPSLLLSFGLALIPILWTYGGWQENTFLSGETKDAQRTVPKILLISIFFVTLAYMAVNLVYIYVFPVERIAASPLIASDLMQVLSGKWAKGILETLILVFAFGAVNGLIITSARITYAISKDNPIFGYLNKADNRFNAPYRSILVNAAWTIILIAWGNFNKLLFFTGTLVWLFFALVGIGIFILRRRFAGMERPYKIWGYPATPLVFTAVCVGLVISTVYSFPAQSIAGFLIMLSGVPAYIVSKKLAQNPSR